MFFQVFRLQRKKNVRESEILSLLRRGRFGGRCWGPQLYVLCSVYLFSPLQHFKRTIGMVGLGPLLERLLADPPRGRTIVLFVFRDFV